MNFRKYLNLSIVPDQFMKIKMASMHQVAH